MKNHSDPALVTALLKRVERLLADPEVYEPAKAWLRRKSQNAEGKTVELPPTKFSLYTALFECDRKHELPRRKDGHIESHEYFEALDKLNAAARAKNLTSILDLRTWEDSMAILKATMDEKPKAKVAA